MTVIDKVRFRINNSALPLGTFLRLNFTPVFNRPWKGQMVIEKIGQRAYSTTAGLDLIF